MATPTIRSTYALDVETVRTLERIARRWRVSKSEALRRAIRAAADRPPGNHDALEALSELQRSLGLSRQQARTWAREARNERRAGSQRGESRG
jgi:hypothetical protein